jgi:hypothetical protein
MTYKITSYIVDSEINIADFGTSWPFSEFPNMNQARVVNGDDTMIVSSYSYINNQPLINSCSVISIPNFPTTDSLVTYTMERNSNSNAKSSQEYTTPLGAGYYKHTVTLSSPLLLEIGKQYSFMVRNQGSSGYYDYKKVGIRNGTAVPSFGVFFGADMSNYDSTPTGSTWNTWYEARFSYSMEHPYYLELNGVSI